MLKFILGGDARVADNELARRQRSGDDKADQGPGDRRRNVEVTMSYQDVSINGRHPHGGRDRFAISGVAYSRFRSVRWIRSGSPSSRT